MNKLHNDVCDADFDKLITMLCIENICDWYVIVVL